MKKKRHTVEQIIRILREADSGLRNDEVCLKQQHQSADLLPLEAQIRGHGPEGGPALA